MKAAVVVEAGRAPVYGEFADPAPAAGQALVRVTAAALSHITRSRAAGTHYSAGGGLPMVPGMDGVGVTADGRRVYFVLPEAPFGAMAEACPVDERRLVAVPDRLGDAEAAAMAMPGMSSWAALVERAKLVRGETVLVNGATGTSGRLAIQVAKHLGAGNVIATGRREDAFDALRRLGADVTVSLRQAPDALEEALQREFRQGIDIVLDYLWGPSAEAVIVAAAKAGPEGVPIRYVQIGAAAASRISLPAAALRSSALTMMGSGLGSIPLPRLLAAIRGVLEAAPAAGFEIAVETVPLAEVERAWTRDDANTRIVLQP
ncbi:MAG TPA: zinc-binding alcohol dehydrogenase family protein [Nitrobacter sp.]|nr:zinc-binding alcohol dehydrogenase family protein [Nitrobacter sp.]